MSIRLLAAYSFGVFLAGSAMAQECQLAGKSDDSVNRRMGPPVIHGQPFVAPSMKWRFQSGAPPSFIEIRYQWQWIDHPYPDHPFGVWLTANETVECRPNDLSIAVPAWTVRPRGWHKGKFTTFPWDKPRFHQVEFVIEWERNCRQTLLLRPQVLGKFRDHEALIKRSCRMP